MLKSTTELLRDLEHLGKVAELLALDVRDANGDGKVDWSDLVAVADGGKLSALIEQILEKGTRQRILNALRDVDASKRALAAGRSYTEMSSAELDRYAALRSLERHLFVAADSVERDRAGFIRWLVETALPQLGSALKIILAVV